MLQYPLTSLFTDLTYCTKMPETSSCVWPDGVCCRVQTWHHELGLHGAKHCAYDFHSSCCQPSEISPVICQCFIRMKCQLIVH